MQHWSKGAKCDQWGTRHGTEHPPLFTTGATAQRAGSGTSIYAADSWCHGVHAWVHCSVFVEAVPVGELLCVHLATARLHRS